MKTLKDIQNLKGVKVLLRVDFNVPILHNKVTDEFRLKSAIPTIDYLRSRGAKVILIAHLESNSGDNLSLEPVSKDLATLGVNAPLVKDYKKAPGIIDAGMKEGECILMENLRFFEGEKKNDPKFAKALASLADIYVNEAFSVCHRKHASIVGVPKYLPSYAGLQLENEIKHLSKAFSPAHPFLFILGGAKFETKLPLLDKFMKTADMVFVGGALASDFFKEKGLEIGKSKTSTGNFNLARYVKSPKLLLPVDVTLADGTIKNVERLTANDRIMDSGPKTVQLLREKVSQSKFILWNGPLGVYEDGYREPTHALARMISEATAKGAESVIGGGDTLASVAEQGLQSNFTFMSTGGGAMLDFLAQGTLPGIEALERAGE
jgi:3-phosphoglycerate kinase